MIYLSVLVLLIGLVVYFITDKGKPMEVGRLMFAVGLLVALLHWSARVVP